MADLFPIAEARGPKTANVIFFHGLGGDAHGTWSADPKDKATFWPAWLAQDIEGLSVYSVGYEASVSGWNGSAMELTDRAANVLNLLLVNPDLGAGQLILVGHSLGGLVIKQVLRKAADEAAEGAEASSFIERVRKVAFLATPHAGSDLAGRGDWLRVLIRPSAATRSLLRNDQHLRDLNLWYRRWARQRGIDHLILTETETTSLFGMIVKPDSSDPGLSSDPVPIDTDHIAIAKPVNRESEVYQLVLSFIKRPTERPVSPEEIRVDALEGPLEKPIDWLFGWKASFERTRQRFGMPVAVLLALSVAGGFILLNWEHIAKIPFVPGVIAFLCQHAVPVPRAEAGRLTIAVAHLARDNEGLEHERLLRDQLDHFESVKTLPLDRTLDPDQPDKKKSEEEARGLLKKDGADVLIWGSVVSSGDKSYMRLYWTPSREVSGAKASDRYQPQTETLALPEAFWSDLKQILGLLTQTRIAALTVDQHGHYVADKLAPLIAQVRALIESKEGVWNSETLAGVRFSLATALLYYGEQSGKNESLAESIELYRKVLDEWTRERVPLDWAMTQNNLGLALETLGARENSTEQLEGAAAAFGEALKVLNRERDSHLWAMAQNNLGLTLKTLGQHANNTEQLEGAIAAFGEALNVFTRERDSHRWAMVQNNLGVTLATLGQRETGTARLDEAVAAYRRALEELTRQRVPMEWGELENNLGVALKILGERKNDTEQLKQAVAAFHEATKELTHERVPPLWAATKRNLGDALKLIGERESDEAQLEAAITAYRETLDYTRAQMPLDWAQTQLDIASTYTELCAMSCKSQYLDYALAAVDGALDEYRKHKTASDVEKLEQIRNQFLGAKGIVARSAIARPGLLPGRPPLPVAK